MQMGTCHLHLQVCLLDLDYNLPVQVRDSATGKEVEDLPESDVNKEYVLQRLSEDGDLDSSFNKQRANDTILKLQRTTPYYKVCSCSQCICGYVVHSSRSLLSLHKHGGTHEH